MVRTKLLAGALLLIAYGTYGILKNDVYLPGKRGQGVHFTGLTAWLAFAAMVLAALHFLAGVVDHYDRRNNEARYRDFSMYTLALACTLFIVALVLGMHGR